MDTAIIHYHEIGLKGRNKSHFENLLMKNIENKLKIRPQREMGHIALDIKDQDKNTIIDKLSKIPGITFFSFATKTGTNLEELKQATLNFAKDKDFETFRISTKRRDKTYKLGSMEVDKELGAVVADELKKKVQLVNPDLDIKVEISNKSAYISDRDIRGVGGMPINTRQKVICLLSGGIDSPVAAYMLMKRGCEVILVHFQNRSQVTKAVENKVSELAEQLSKFQINTKLFIIPFDNLQQDIINKVKPELRMLAYRAIMTKIATILAKGNKAKFLVTGDNLSQVASQTWDNLHALYKNTEIPVLSPLIGLDKQEIINLAKRIGTFDISSLPYADCCTYFVPKHPELHATAGVIRACMENIEESLLTQVIGLAKVFEF